MGLKDRIKQVWDEVMAPVFDDLATNVGVEVFDESATTVDELYGEAEGEKAFKDPVTLKARVKIERSRVVMPGGESEEIDGKVVFKTEDLEAASLVLDFGNRVTVGGASYVVVRIESAGQVGDQFLLTKAWLRKEEE